MQQAIRRHARQTQGNYRDQGSSEQRPRLRTMCQTYRDRRIERHSNIYKPLGISDVYKCLVI